MREKLFITRCARARYCWRNKNYITRMSRTFARANTFSRLPRLARHRPFLRVSPLALTPVPFVRTEVARLNCESRDNYAPRDAIPARRVRNAFPAEESRWGSARSRSFARSKIMRSDNWQRAIDIRFVSMVNKIPGVLLITRSVRRCGCLFTARTAWRIRSAAYWHVNVNLLIVNTRCLFRGDRTYLRGRKN